MKGKNPAAEADAEDKAGESTDANNKKTQHG